MEEGEKDIMGTLIWDEEDFFSAMKCKASEPFES